ncbi:MAG: hypothetical protein U0168_03475 [Nannocystaceae bacterium]
MQRLWRFVEEEAALGDEVALGRQALPLGAGEPELCEVLRIGMAVARTRAVSGALAWSVREGDRWSWLPLPDARASAVVTTCSTPSRSTAASARDVAAARGHGGGPVIATWLALALASAPPSLEAARRDEIEALQAEARRARAATSRRPSSAAVARKALEGEIDALSDALERVQLDNARRERSLPVAEQARALDPAPSAGRAANIDAWLLQRNLAPPPAEGPEQLPQGFAAALEAIAADAALRIEPAQTWFDADGTAHTGAVLRVGRVAAISWNARAALVTTAWGLQAAAGVAGERSERGGALQLRAVVLQDPDSTVDARAWLGPTGARPWTAAAADVGAAGVRAGRGRDACERDRDRLGWPHAARCSAASLRWRGSPAIRARRSAGTRAPRGRNRWWWCSRRCAPGAAARAQIEERDPGRDRGARAPAAAALAVVPGRRGRTARGVCWAPSTA